MLEEIGFTTFNILSLVWFLNSNKSDNLESINQSSIFDYVQDEFCLKSKSNKIDSIYKELI